ncbi:MAG: phosphatidate cytidylyltransferase, partial [Beijerinckiaceae bacterium]|nr:phosphatidate cytidylyltransferase [Beijerinckiaceae bacterium]
MNADAGSAPSPQEGSKRPQGPLGNLGDLGDLGVRVGSAIVMVALALGALWIGGWLFAAFWTVAGIVIIWEWQHLVGGEALSLRMGAGAGAAAVTAGLASLGYPQAALSAILLGAGAVAFASGRERAAWAGAGVLYAGALVLAVCVLRNSLFYGLAAILWLFAVVWTTDIMAYFGGRLIGGPKLWPRVSPGKTWSGFLVGITCGAAAGCAIALWWTTPGEASLLPLIVLGLLTAALSQAGDLFESAVKRRFGAKDSGHIIPGHGGA